MSTIANTQEIKLPPVPPRVYAKLQEIAAFGNVEAWARNAIIEAAEEARPSLQSSGLWRSDTAEWCYAGDEDSQ